LKIIILCVGGIKTNFLKMGIKQYEKWLSRYIKVETLYLKSGGDINRVPKEKVLHNEATKLIKYIKDDYYNILLDKGGEEFSSEDFAKFIDQTIVDGSKSAILFVVGGVHGVSENIKNKVDKKISLSRMTFTHELSVFILLEQLYRAFKIINNEKYHY
jgi:23S rRNA (pseudouridine1915-N3)-methyltransferase